MWLDTAMPLLRSVIQDISINPDYSNSRLTDVLFSAAHLLLSEITFDYAYSVNLVTRVVSPDPETDVSFLNMVTYKSALIVLNHELKTSARQGIMVKDGPSILDTRDFYKNRKSRYELMSKEYDKVKLQIKMGDLNAGLAIIGPQTNENKEPYIWR